MKRISAGLAVILWASVSAAAPAAAESTWNLDADHSEVGFVVKHLMVSNVRGSFHQVTGEVTMDEKDISKSKLNVNIATTSIDTRVEKRDNHLRSPDFFDVAKFPSITFKSTKVKKAGKSVQITGDLTIRDVTKSVTLTAEISKPVKDPWNNERIAVNATGKINRKDFGLKYNQALETGGVMVSEEVAIEINSEFIKKVAPAATTAEAAAPAPVAAPTPVAPSTK